MLVPLPPKACPPLRESTEAGGSPSGKKVLLCIAIETINGSERECLAEYETYFHEWH